LPNKFEIHSSFVFDSIKEILDSFYLDEIGKISQYNVSNVAVAEGIIKSFYFWFGQPIILKVDNKGLNRIELTNQQFNLFIIIKNVLRIKLIAISTRLKSRSTAAANHRTKKR